MNEVPEGKNMEGTYERFIASCPWCGRRNVFNRASDLGDFEPIDHKDVSCLFPDCSKPFFLTGDTINPAYEMVIYDCYELIEQKYYAYCILNLCQSFELFFSQYLRVELVYRPFASGVRDERLDLDIRHFNDLRNLLYARLRGLTFEPMRNLFFCLVLRGPGPGSLEEAERLVRIFPCYPGVPSDDEIRAAAISGNERVRESLLRLKSCKVHELRNEVVHKSGYRPNLSEVKDALEETRQILFPLGHDLKVQIDDLNWYMTQRA